MPMYKVRNNTANDLPVQTRTGFHRLASKEVATLDLIHVNSPRMRALQQGGQLSLKPAANAGGSLSPKLPALHLGVAKKYPPLT